MTRNWEKIKKQKRPFYKTVYMRLLLAYIAIIIVTVVVLTFLMRSMIYYYNAEELNNEMVRECRYINDNVMPMWLAGGEQKDTARSELAIIARKYDAQIWIMDRKRVVYLESGDNWKMDQKVLSEGGPAAAVDAIFAGEELKTLTLSDPDTRERILTVGRPFLFNDRIEGAILMSQRTIDVTITTEKIYSSLMIPSAIAVLLTVFLLSVILRRFTSPLAQMNDIAKSYAKGDFAQRVRVTSNDEIGQLADSFNAMADDLQGLEDMRRSFVANVSHELKSPLASMWGFLQAVLDGSIKERDQKEYLQIVLDETQRLSVLINDLLDLSKIESGEVPINPSSFDINELIARTLITFEQRLDEKQIHVELIFEPEQIMLWADKERITQVIRNLVDNAIKYLPLAGTLTIVSKENLKEGIVMVQVRDTGTGIPQRDLQHIWERFYKVDKAHTPGKEGTGLGLSIVKRIIDQHDGSISVTSEEGVGTEFVFYLPIVERPSLSLRKRGRTDGADKERRQ